MNRPGPPERTPRRRAAWMALLLLVGGSRTAAEPLQTLSGSVPRLLRRMTVVASAPDDLPLPHVTVLLGIRHRAALEALLAAQQDPRSPHFLRWLDNLELADRFGPTRTEYERVRSWFVTRGFRVIQDSPLRLAIVVAGTAGDVRTALGTSIVRLHHRGRLYRGPAGDPALPTSVAASVRGVLGLDDLPRFRPLVRLDGGLLALAPTDFASAYAVSPLHAAGLTGVGHSVAVVARSNFADRDVALFAERFLPTPGIVPQRRLVGEDPGISRDLAEEIEVLIDTQWASALAPGAQVNVVISSPEGDIPESLAQAVYRREGDVISISFGLCEPAAPTLLTELFDAFYALANAKGQTVVVAAGDSGGTECAPADRRRAAVNLLASSPHAVAVGGTSFLLAADGTPSRPLTEQVWNDAYGAGGGGDSEIFARPRYQLSAGLPLSGGRRALPDLSLAGSPRTPGYVIVEGGQNRVVGGTSVGAPALASILMLANEHLRQRTGTSGLGQLVPQIYRLGSEQARGLRPSVFRDVTIGSNALPGGVGFEAGPGFDRASGWGTPLADAFVAALDGPRRCEPATDCLVPARRSRRHACHGEWLVEHDRLAVRGGLPRVHQDCRDGDPACDTDGQKNGTCTVNVALCVNVFDARPALVDQQGLPVCQAGRIRRVRILGPRRRSRQPQASDNRKALKRAAAALPIPGMLRGACTATVPVVIPVRQDGTSSGMRFRARVERPRGRTDARLVLRCLAA